MMVKQNILRYTENYIKNCGEKGNVNERQVKTRD